MKQVKKLQEDMLKAQEELANKFVTGTAGGGMVSVKANGQKQVVEVKIKPEAIDPDDLEMLQDLLLVAINDALKQAEELANKDLGKFTAGFNIPGLF